MTGPRMISRSFLRTVYMGQPDAGLSMRKLSIPDSSYTVPLTRGGALTQLVSGGYIRSVRPQTHRAPYTFNWSDRTRDEAAGIRAFYTGLYGEGPFCLVDPIERNLLSLSQSTCGRQFEAVDGAGWVTLNGTDDLDYSSDNTGPGEDLCGIVEWTTDTVGTLFAGDRITTDGLGHTVYYPSLGSTTSVGTAIPYLKDQPLIASVGIRVTAGAAVGRLSALGLAVSADNDPGRVQSSDITLSPTWARYAVLVDVGSVGWDAALWASMDFKITSLVGTAVVQMTCPQIQVGSYPLPSPDPIIVETYDPWLPGMGVARVIPDVTAELSGSIWERQSHAMKFYEV